MFKHFRETSKSDRGDTLIIFLMSLPLIMLLIGFSVNINSSINAGTEYKSMAQNAVEVAVKRVDSRGGLGLSAVEAFRNEYFLQTGISGLSSGGNSDTATMKSRECSVMEIDGVQHQMPYMQVRLETSRGAASPRTSDWVMSGQGAAPLENKNLGNNRYRVISATVYNSSTNPWGFPGLPKCQLHKVEVSAITFGSNTDIN